MVILILIITLRDISKRWTVIDNHEDYNAGHLMEAAVAYYDVTGKRKLLDVAIRLANHIDSTFRMQNKKWFSGHEEIEIGSNEIVSGNRNDRYLKISRLVSCSKAAKIFILIKGKWVNPAYWQDVLPVKDQTEITGHAVRAMYLYSGRRCCCAYGR